MNNLIMKGLVKKEFHSNSYRGLLLTNLGRQHAKQLKEAEVQEKAQDSVVTLRDDIFEDVTGHDAVKELLEAVILAEKPIYVLLAVPSAPAKGEDKQPESQKAMAMKNTLYI